MKRLVVAFILLTALPAAGMAAAEQATGTESGPPGAGPPGYQAWPGQTMSTTEQAPAKHVSAAAALQSGKNDQAKEHARAAEKAAGEATEKSKEALNSGPSK